METFKLKHPGSCSGMFWRDVPTGAKPQLEAKGTKPDWPKNGAVLRGVVHDLPAPVQRCTKWLEVQDYSPDGSSNFVPAPACWMQVRVRGQGSTR